MRKLSKRFFSHAVSPNLCICRARHWPGVAGDHLALRTPVGGHHRRQAADRSRGRPYPNRDTATGGAVTTRSGTNPNHGNVHNAIAIPSRSAGPRPRPGSTNARSAGESVKNRNSSSRHDLREFPQTSQLLIREHPRRHETDLPHQPITLGAEPTSNRPSPQTEPGPHRQSAAATPYPLVFRRLLPEPLAARAPACGPTGSRPLRRLGHETSYCSAVTPGQGAEYRVGRSTSKGNSGSSARSPGPAPTARRFSSKPAPL